MHPDLVQRLPVTLTESSVLAIIPARYQSSRFPGKPLADIAGRPMIEHVYRRAASATLVSAVVVATDDDRIAAAVNAFGGVAVMTRTDHTSGTDRVAEVVSALPCRLVVNVQGDEPLIEPAMIDEAIAPLLADASLDIGTLSRPFRDAAEFTSPHVVKVVTDQHRQALYFSRAAIPHSRDGSSLTSDVLKSASSVSSAAQSASSAAPSVPSAARAHIGLYVYRRDILLRLASLPPSTLERLEALEQLRALEHGIRIHVTDTQFESIGVDTPADLNRVRQRLLVAPRT